MSKQQIEINSQSLLALARKLAETPGMTWVDANNAIYSPSGAFARLFPTKADRLAFSSTHEHQQIDDLIDSLPDPPVRAEPLDYDSKYYIRLDTAQES